MEHNRANQQDPVLLLGELFHPAFRLLHCAEAFYRQVGYRGSLTIEAATKNVRLQRMLFIPRTRVEFDELDDFQCFEDVVAVTETTESEKLSANVVGVVQGLMRQVCWSFWQATDRFPADTLDQYIAQIVGGMDVR